MSLCMLTVTVHGAGLVGLIPEGTPEKLTKLVVGVVSQNLQKWREQSAGNELSLPALKVGYPVSPLTSSFPSPWLFCSAV